MTEAQAIELICQTFITGWGSTSAVVIGDEAAPSAATFVRLSVRHTTSEQITLGAVARFERRGWIFVQVFAPPGDLHTLAGLCDTTRTVLERQSLSSGSGEPVTVNAGLTQEMPASAKWAMRLVRFPFRYYESR